MNSSEEQQQKKDQDISCYKYGECMVCVCVRLWIDQSIFISIEKCLSFERIMCAERKFYKCIDVIICLWKENQRERKKENEIYIQHPHKYN